MKKVYIVMELVEDFSDRFFFDETYIRGVFDSKDKAIDFVKKVLLVGKGIIWQDDDDTEYITSNINMNVKRTTTIREFEVQ